MSLFGFKRKPLDIAKVTPDIHSHLIPGIDDGAQTLEDALAMVRKMVSMGYNHLITTPHIMWDSYKNTPEIIRAGLATLREACAEEGITVRLDAAAEYFIDEHFLEMLRTGGKLLTLPGKRLLVELPYSTPLMNTSETLFSIITHGYVPVLAHPERYTYFHNNLPVYEKLAAQGCLLQLNALSVSGYYGGNVQKVAQWLLKKRLITFIGSDAHHHRHTEALEKALASPVLSKYPFLNAAL